MFSWVIVSCVVALAADLVHGADRIRFAYPAKSLNYLPIMLGRDKGIYQTEGIDLQMVLVTSPVQVTALTTADIDFSGAQSQVMAGAARGLPVKVVGFITTKPSFWLVAKPELKSMSDLKGKIIGITAIGSSTDTLARALLSKSGLTPDKDFTLFGTGTTSNILVALKGGSIDAGVLSPPFNATAKLMGFRTLAYFGDHFEQSLSGIGTSDKDGARATGHGETGAARYVEKPSLCSTESSRCFSLHRAKNGRLDPAVAEELYRSMLPAFSKDGGMDEKGIRDGLKRETERMALKEETPVSRVLDLRLLREVQNGF